jgi:NAD(P)-dependent dehydrogenase (short-subunit alcohol dehydrogenase family)
MTRTGVVIGGTSGIGLRAVERLLDEDWTVWVAGRRSDLPPELQPAIESGRLVFRRCDVRNADDIDGFFAEIGEAHTALDAVIYSAGVNITGELESIPIEDADLTIDVNFRGPWLSIRAAIPLLRKAARVDAPARAILVGSIGGIRPKISGGIYGATKAAAHVIAQVFAVELGPSNITVNVVAPGSTDTPMIASAVAEGGGTGYKASGVSPLGRIGRPDDVADAILFLLSDQAKFINGAVLPVDGGTRSAYVNR